METILEIKGLKKYYKSGIRGLVVAALDGLDLEVKKGEIFGMLGPNGAGKSTAIKIILGLLKANSGECKIFGEKMSSRLRKRIGYLPEAPNFYKFLSAKELIVFYAKLCGMKGKQAEEASIKALELVGLSDALNRRLSTYSKGMLQRAGLAQAIVHDPEFVILDEPSSGLDPIGMADMADMILRLKADGKTVLLCSHMMDEVEKLCDRVAIIAKGKVLASGSLDDLLEKANTTNIVLENLSENGKAALEATAIASGAKILEVSAAKISLSEYFNKLVKKELQ